MTSAPPLHVQGLTCCYGDQQALDRVSLTLRAGEILGVTGRTGAGISTLIKGILLLVAPRAGQVFVFSKPHTLPGSRARMAYLPENVQTPGHLTGHDVINMTRTVHGETSAGTSIEELAIDLDLPLGRLVHPTRDYSREDVQKLGLICLLSTGRPILLLDQPMTSIGAAARAGLTNRLRDHASKGGAVLLGSHLVDDHEGIADRLITLKEGRLHAEERPDGRDQPDHEEACLDTRSSLPARMKSPGVAQRPPG